MAESDPRGIGGVRDPPEAGQALRELAPDAPVAMRIAAWGDRFRTGAGAWLEREIEAGRGCAGRQSGLVRISTRSFLAWSRP